MTTHKTSKRIVFVSMPGFTALPPGFSFCTAVFWPAQSPDGFVEPPLERNHCRCGFAGSRSTGRSSRPHSRMTAPLNRAPDSLLPQMKDPTGFPAGHVSCCIKGRPLGPLQIPYRLHLIPHHFQPPRCMRHLSSFERVIHSHSPQPHLRHLLRPGRLSLRPVVHHGGRPHPRRIRFLPGDSRPLRPVPPVQRRVRPRNSFWVRRRWYILS